MRQISKHFLTKVIQPNIISKLNTNSFPNKPYKFSFKKNMTEGIQHIFQDLNNWYVNVIGLAEVKMFQDRVVQVQAKLLETQEKRREMSKQLAEIRMKSKELQDQIHKHKREDDLDKFLDVMRQETEILRKEKEISRIFTEYDREERDLFTAFTNAVRESHEKQRSQLEYTKYLGLVLSIVGSFLTFCYSSLKKHELKCFIDEKLNVHHVPATSTSIETHKELQGLIDVLKKDTTRLFTQNINVVKDNHKELKNMLNILNTNILTAFKNNPIYQSMPQSVPSQNYQPFENNVELDRNVNLLALGLTALLVICILKCCCG